MSEEREKTIDGLSEEERDARHAEKMKKKNLKKKQNQSLKKMLRKK